MSRMTTYLMPKHEHDRFMKLHLLLMGGARGG